DVGPLSCGMNSPVIVPSRSGRLVAVAGSGPAAILVMMVPLIAGLRAVHVAPASALVHSGSDPEGPLSPPAIRRTGGLTAATAIASMFDVESPSDVQVAPVSLE